MRHGIRGIEGLFSLTFSEVHSAAAQHGIGYYGGWEGESGSLGLQEDDGGGYRSSKSSCVGGAGWTGCNASDAKARSKVSFVAVRVVKSVQELSSYSAKQVLSGKEEPTILCGHEGAGSE